MQGGELIKRVLWHVPILVEITEGLNGRYLRILIFKKIPPTREAAKKAIKAILGTSDIIIYFEFVIEKKKKLRSHFVRNYLFKE